MGRDSDRTQDPCACSLARLVARIAAGDTAAEEELFVRVGVRVQRLLWRRAGSHALAEDLLQETFRIVLQRLRTRGLERPDRVLEFLFGTALTLLRAERRRAARNRWTGLDLDSVADPRGTPLTQALSGERTELVQAALSGLRERDRQILWRFYFLGQEKDQIRRDLGVDSVHFNRVLFRARERLREALPAEMRKEK